MQKLNVFVDLHQGDLYYSLQLLIEKRLGWNLYRPIGMEWYFQGFWNIGDPYPNPADTAKQYLGIDDRVWDAYKNLNADYKLEEGIFHVWDPVHKTHQKAITLEKFKEMDIDIVISSFPFGHDQTYKRLVEIFKPKAKLVSQMGNINQHTDLKNILCSVAPFPSDKNIVFYHQEFDLSNYVYKPPENHSIIRSFINLHPMADLYQQYKEALPEFTLQSFGASCPDGTISSDAEIGKLMSESAFGWQVKPGGDGYGYVIHNWFASGRPVITNLSDYQDKLAGELLIDDVTCINLEARSFQENIERIKYWSESGHHEKMCQNVYNRFKEVVDFDREAKEIKQFFDNLIDN